jgi:hypothetical protein
MAVSWIMIAAIVAVVAVVFLFFFWRGGDR